MMNIKWILIGAVFVILLVAFGNNPIEEGRKQREEAMKGKDPLIHAIDEYNKEGAGKYTGDRGARMDMPSGGIRVAPAPTNPSYGYGSGQPGAFGSPEVGQIAPPSARRAPAGSTAQPPQNSYYPPPAETGADPRLGPRGDLRLNSDPLRTLANGQRLSFFGAQVFKVGADGKKTPLADGKYPMFDGRINMVVKNGMKVGLSN